MLTKHLTFVLILLFCVQQAHAQVDFRRFPLDSFKLPDIDRSALNFSGAFFGDYSNVNLPEFNNRSLNSTFSPQVGLTYSRQINRQDIQATIAASTFHDLSISHNKLTITNNLTDFDSRSSVFAERLKYKGTSFVETGFSISYSNFYKQRTLNEIKENSFFSDLFITVGTGSGRLEQVSDVAMAMFILNDALDLGLDGSTFTTEKIYEFASLMAEVRNERIFDARRKRVQELRELYNFMLNQEWVVPNDPGYFTVLTDNWTYNTRIYRTTGKRWSYLLVPEVHYRSDHKQGLISPTSKQKNLDFGGNFVIDFVRSRPKSLFMDNVRQHRLSAGMIRRDDYDANERQSSSFMQLNIENSIGKKWYPNNRTYIICSMNADYSYYHYIDPPELIEDDDEHNVTTGLSAQFSYFISYRTQFVANASVQYAFNNGRVISSALNNSIFSNIESSGFNANLNASIVVAIF